MTVQYWLGSFDAKSWNVFLSLRPSTIGLKNRPDINIGDIFINYVKGESPVPGQWVSAERVTSEMKYDAHRIYKDGIWPHRWHVEPITPRHLFGEGVVAKGLIGEMKMFSHLNEHSWGSALRSQGREIPAPDGELLVELLKK